MSDLKGLLIGRNPINTVTGNGKTLATFFAQFEKANLFQIYVSDLPADDNICSSFLHISELAVLKTVCGKREVVNSQAKTKGLDSVTAPSALHAIIKKVLRSKTGVWIRNSIWKKMRWVSPTIIDFLQKQNPDFLFYDVGNLPFEYEIAVKFADHYNVPLILYVSDDYIYTSKRITSHRQKVIESYEKMASRASLIIVISEAMKQKYSHHVASTYIVAMNGCDNTYPFSNCSFDYTNIKAVYTGNIGLGRLEMLRNVAAALGRLTQEAKLRIYSSFNIDEKKKQQIEQDGVCLFCGSVYGTELTEAWEDANLLVYVESFNHKYRNVLSTAISTKVSEYMLTGRPILVVAPEYSESARFIDRERAGVVVYSDSCDDIYDGIQRVICSNKDIREMVIRSKNFAINNLTKETVAKKVYSAIKQKATDWVEK